MLDEILSEMLKNKHGSTLTAAELTMILSKTVH